MQTLKKVQYAFAYILQPIKHYFLPISTNHSLVSTKFSALNIPIRHKVSANGHRIACFVLGREKAAGRFLPLVQLVHHPQSECYSEFVLYRLYNHALPVRLAREAVWLNRMLEFFKCIFFIFYQFNPRQNHSLNQVL